MPPAKNDAEIAQRNLDAGLQPPPKGFIVEPGSTLGMTNRFSENPQQPTRAQAFPGPATPAELPTGHANVGQPARAGQPGMRFVPMPPSTLTKPNAVTLPGRNMFYDAYEKYLGGPAEAGANLYTGLTGLVTQGGRGLYGMATGEDPMKTEAAQQRIGEATTWQPRTAQGKSDTAALHSIMGFPSIPAERAGQYLAEQGHPWAATGARIALDPYTYLPFLFRGGARPELVGPPRPPGLRVEPGMGPETFLASVRRTSRACPQFAPTSRASPKCRSRRPRSARASRCRMAASHLPAWCATTTAAHPKASTARYGLRPTFGMRAAGRGAGTA
jgi:hypothetical protein